MESIASKLLLPCLNNNNLFPSSKLSCFPLTLVPTKPPKIIRLKATTTTTTYNDDQECNRTFKKLPPSPWTDLFHSVSIDVREMDELRKEINALKPEVKNILMSPQGIDSTKKRILMIYVLVSLGLAHHFEEEIYGTLEEGFKKVDEMMDGEDDLYTVSTLFWVFRTYGHYISSDVFLRFKGNKGNFKESLNRDAKGILSLYEAAHLRTTKDYILEEALSFASNQLESLAACETCPPHLSMRIRNALIVSQRWNMDIVAAMEYIPSYEQEKNHDEMLLKFAKLSFKLVQLQYLEDLKIVTKWYKGKDFSSKFPPYFRDRIVENYFFVLAVFFEPQLSLARIMCTKYFTILGIEDDTFDRFASLTEVECLVNSLERWAPDYAMDKQPDYLKFVLNFILDTFKEFEIELRPEGKSFSVEANIEEIKILAKSQYDFEKWAHAAHVPSFEDYIEVGIVENAAYASLACYVMCMGKMAIKEDYVWLKSRPKLAQSISIKLRLVNDIYGYEDDMGRGYVTNAVNCYMKQYGVTKQEAVKELHKMVVDADLTINEEMLTTTYGTTTASRLFLNASMGLAKMTTICYNGYEGFTHTGGKIKEYMTSLFIDQIRL